eukprot:3025955-Amphidinium_carterae.1
MIARVLQSLAPEAILRSELFLDDPLWQFWGSVRSRSKLLSLLLLTLGAIGMNLSWKKGARGQQIVWIGVTLQPICADKTLLISLPQKFREEVVAEIATILTTSM